MALSEFDKLSDEAIDKLASWNVSEAVEAMTGVCELFAKAGYNRQQFEEYRVYMIQSAKLKLGIKSTPEDKLCVFNQFIVEAEKAAANERRAKEHSPIIH